MYWLSRYGGAFKNPLFITIENCRVELELASGKARDAEEFLKIERLQDVGGFRWNVGAGIPNNGLGLESPATCKCARTLGLFELIEAWGGVDIGGKISDSGWEVPCGV